MMPESLVFSDQIALLLQVCCGFFWLVCYLTIIFQGFKDKMCGMPFLALCLNITWEVTFSIVFPHHAPQILINWLWLVFDCIIAYQLLEYGKKEMTRHVHGSLYYPMFILIIVVSFFANVTITQEFNDLDGKYTAFGINLLMSVLYITGLVQRNSTTGQSMYIALSKMLGSTAASFLFFTYYPESMFLLFLYISIFIFDWMYIVMLYRKFKELRIHPWMRKSAGNKVEELIGTAN